MDRSEPPLVAINDPALACLLRDMLPAMGIVCEVVEDAADCSRAPLCRWLNDPSLSDAIRLRLLLDEAIAVLERTRHAFKSRELGLLRRRLEEAREELSHPAPLV